MAKNEKEKKQKSSYFKEMKAELKKVVWPTPKELVNNTVAVIVFVLIIAVIVFILDFCFDNLNKYGITRLQESVQSAFQTTEDSESNSEVENADETSENNDEDSANDTEADGTETDIENEENTNSENSSEQENTENDTESNE
jgi:preprotein translocase SecE subunit